MSSGSRIATVESPPAEIPGGAIAARAGWIRSLLPSAIGALLLWWVLRGADWPHLLRTLQSIHPGWILLETAGLLLSLWIRAVRWQIILAPVQRISVWGGFSASAIGFMANNVLPLRIGEVVRAYAINRREKVPFSSALSSIVVDRLLDGLTVAGFAVILLWVVDIPTWLRVASALGAGLFIGAVPLLVMVSRRGHRAEQWERTLRAWLPARIRDRAAGAVARFIDGLSILRDLRGFVLVVLCTLPIWILWAGYYEVGIVAMGWHLPWFTPFMIVVVLALAVSLPSLPGAVGAFQVGCVVALMLAGVGRQDALVYAVVFHAIQYVVVTILGFICFFAEGWRFSDLLQAGK